MFVTLLTSLSARIRDAALEGLQGVLSGSVLLRCDLIDPRTLAVRVHRPGRAPEIHFVPVGPGCPAEASAAAAVRILAAEGRPGGDWIGGGGAASDVEEGVPGCAVIALPPGANGLAAHQALVSRSLGLPLAVDSVALAVEPAAVEDVMAFALAHADTVLAVDDPLWGALEGGARADYRAASERGMRLLRERAPHAVINAPGRVSVLGHFDPAAAGARMKPVAVKTATGLVGPF